MNDLDKLRALLANAHEAADDCNFVLGMQMLDTLIQQVDALIDRANYEPDNAYERAAARARNNDFADTDGKDWT